MVANPNPNPNLNPNPNPNPNLLRSQVYILKVETWLN